MTAIVPTHPSLKERQRAERETLILDEAERMLGEVGYQDLVMEQLAERVGIGKGTIYLHFPKKEDLLGAIIMRSLGRVNEQIAAFVADDTRSALERLQAVMTMLVDSHFTSWMSTMAGPQKHALFSAVSSQTDMREQITRFFDGLGAVIDQGKDRGEFDTAIATPFAALALAMQVQSLSTSRVMERSGMSRQELAASASRLFFRGLCARSDSGEERP